VPRHQLRYELQTIESVRIQIERYPDVVHGFSRQDGDERLPPKIPPNDCHISAALFAASRDE